MDQIEKLDLYCLEQEWAGNGGDGLKRCWYRDERVERDCKDHLGLVRAGMGGEGGGVWGNVD